MNISRSKILLKKINALHESGVNISSGLSSLERDLLLQYIRELYEAIVDHAEPKETMNGDNYHRPYTEKIQPTPQSRVSTQDFYAPNVIVQNLPDGSQQENVRRTTVEPISSPSSTKVLLDPAVEELFEESSTSVSRFGDKALTELSKAFSINEKILTINELFGGNQQAYSTAIEALDRLISMEEAKTFLTRDIVAKYNWTSPSKRNKAQQFIQLIRRRYI